MQGLLDINNLHMAYAEAERGRFNLGVPFRGMHRKDLMHRRAHADRHVSQSVSQAEFQLARQIPKKDCDCAFFGVKGLAFRFFLIGFGIQDVRLDSSFNWCHPVL